MKLKNWLWHLVAWAGFWGVLILARGREGAEWSLVMGSLACFVVISTLLSYVNYLCLERFMDQQRYGAYFLRMVPFFLGSNAVLGLALAYVRQEKLEFWGTLPTLFITWLLSTGTYFFQSGIRRQKQLQDARARQLEAEMQLLKMQIQPHFLFNALNNLYATNLQNPAKANEMILQLADLLRYQLEISKRAKVALAEEITLTEHFIELEKIRLYDAVVEVEKRGDFENLQITPLLFLPLVENAFKHSAGIGPQYIQVCFEVEGEKLSFVCQNSIAAKPSPKTSNQLGLQNVRQRLLADYPQRHQLDIEHTPEKYHLSLTLQLESR